MFGELVTVTTRAFRDIWPKDQTKHGMLDFDKVKTWDLNKFDVDIDRDNEKMKITAHVGFLWLGRDEFKFNLSGWTSRYGKPIELSLALHLSTMAPDFAYNFCNDDWLQTLIKINVTKLKYNMEYYYQPDNSNLEEPISRSELNDLYSKIKEKEPPRIERIFRDDIYLGHTKVRNQSLMYAIEYPEEYAGSFDVEAPYYDTYQGAATDPEDNDFNECPLPDRVHYGILYNDCIVCVEKSFTAKSEKYVGDFNFSRAVDKEGNPVFSVDTLKNPDKQFKITFDGDTPYFTEVGDTVVKKEADKEADDENFYNLREGEEEDEEDEEVPAGVNNVVKVKDLFKATGVKIGNRTVRLEMLNFDMLVEQAN